MRSRIVSWETTQSSDTYSVGWKSRVVQRASPLGTAGLLAVLSVLLAIPFNTAHAQAGGTVLYNFAGLNQSPPDGFYPESRLTFDSSGNLYGTTMNGGAGKNFSGTVFELSPELAGGCASGSNTGNGWCETVLYSFCSLANCADGEVPAGDSVIFDGQGNLYGTTLYGGITGGASQCDSLGCGTVFELSPEPASGCPSGSNPGNGWCETVIYAFQGPPNDAAGPISGLVWDSSGNLYGTTVNGGVTNEPTSYAYELSPNGRGSWNEQLIYAVGAAGGGLVIDASGDLYGYNDNGSTDYLYKLSLVNSAWTLTNIHGFTSGTKDGYFPYGEPVIDSAGNVYGTTYYGGSARSGTVWKLTPVTKGKDAGTYKEKILHSFNPKKEGYNPYTGVTLDSLGNIYGATTTGGPFGSGSVFEVAASGAAYTYKVLWTFDGTDGGVAAASPILDGSGHLYGTTEYGGSNSDGNVYELNLSASATTTTLISSPNPSTSGEAVTFTATISSSAGSPADGDIVNFIEGSTLLGTGSLSGGSASFTTSSLRAGTKKIDALYVGDFNFAASTSNTVEQVVNESRSETHGNRMNR